MRRDSSGRASPACGRSGRSCRPPSRGSCCSPAIPSGRTRTRLRSPCSTACDSFSWSRPGRARRSPGPPTSCRAGHCPGGWRTAASPCSRWRCTGCDGRRGGSSPPGRWRRWCPSRWFCLRLGDVQDLWQVRIAGGFVAGALMNMAVRRLGPPPSRVSRPPSPSFPPRRPDRIPVVLAAGAGAAVGRGRPRLPGAGRGTGPLRPRARAGAGATPPAGGWPDLLQPLPRAHLRLPPVRGQRAGERRPGAGRTGLRAAVPAGRPVDPARGLVALALRRGTSAGADDGGAPRPARPRHPCRRSGPRSAPATPGPRWLGGPR